MKREDNMEMELLSLQCFGKRYEWRKLTKKGIVVGTDIDNPLVYRRIPLTVDQAKKYMEKSLEMRAQVLADMEKKNDSSSE